MSVMEQVGLPAGRYPARIDHVTLLEGGRQKAWQLRLSITVLRNGTELSVDRPLSKDPRDPYAITAAQRKSLQAFAQRLHAQDHGPVEEITASIVSLAGQEVLAHLKAGPMGVAVTLHASNGHTDDDQAVAGQILDKLPTVEPEYRQRTLDAQGAHEQLLTGLHHAHRGLALVAEACWRLRNDEGWVAIGYDTVGQYLASPEVAMSRSQFYSLADIWDQYVDKGGQDEIRLCAPSKLEVPLVALKAGDVSAAEALTDAETLGLRDLREKYRGEQQPEKPPKEKTEIEFPISCRACGVVIEEESGVRLAAGIVYRSHRWPDAWSHDQILAAVAAAEEVVAS